VGGLVGASTLVAAHSFTLVRDSVRAEKCEAIKLGQNSRIYDRSGTILATIAAENNRDPVRYDQMPKFLIDATVAIEDKRFFEHSGIDYKRIGGAAVNDLKGSGGRQGGSTITMQLMKNLCHPNDRVRPISNKLQEAYWAKEYERQNDKRSIMQRYLNGVFYGNNTIGVQAASLTYFDHPASELTLPQAALLAGLPQAPSRYNPFVNKDDQAINRRNLVLDEMAKDGYITQERAEQAKQAGLGLKRGNAFRDKKEGYYVDFVQSVLETTLAGNLKKVKKPKERAKKRKEAREKLQNSGYKVYTAIDPALQRAARSAMRSFLTSRWRSDGPSAALVMIEAKTGLVRAMASSDPYTSRSQFNLAGPSAGRGAGSTFKVFVLTAAMEQGVSASTQYFSKSPVPIDGGKCASPAGSGSFVTFGRKGGGMKTLVAATTTSDNSIYAQLTCDVGPEAVFQTAKKMGITSLEETGPTADRYNISMGLGGLWNGVNVLDMARAYAPLANGGYRVNVMPMTRLVRRDGKVVRFKPKRTKIFSDGVAAEVTKVLRQNVLGGTGTAANLSNVPVAGKTGTTTGFKDAWFVGYTPKYVTAVWIGYPGAQRFTGLTGGESAARIWHDFMAVATKGESGQSFLTPKTPFVAKPFSGYYRNQAAALAAAAAKAKADAAAKAKAEADKDKPKPDEPTDPATPPAPGTPPPATPPPATPPPATPPAATPTPTTP
jgi:penicillin-binding protein 1A